MSDITVLTITAQDIPSLSLESWLEIAAACENSPKWGYFRWAENSSYIGAITIDRWLEIADKVGYSPSWATKQYLAHKNSSKVSGNNNGDDVDGNISKLESTGNE